MWSSGLLAVQRKIGLRAVYDLSATPFFLSGSGYGEGKLFPWVVSDFSLIDAIESGIVKIPRVPIADDSMTGELPTYRNIWLRIRDDLPKKGRKAEAFVGEPKLPGALKGACPAFTAIMRRRSGSGRRSVDAAERGARRHRCSWSCAAIRPSQLVFDWIAGWDTGRTHPDGAPLAAAGHLSLFANVDHDRWTAQPNSILVDSQQLESGDAMSPEFKKLAATEIEEFKAEYRARFPGRSADDLTDEDLLREVMNTVGKAGKLGEDIRCVVSVSMLTEGWDANTVTHILGIRAFGTQLLCEQVVGRGLRRMSYVANADGRFEPNAGSTAALRSPCSRRAGPEARPPVRVRAMEDRIDRDPLLACRDINMSSNRTSMRASRPTRVPGPPRPSRGPECSIVGEKAIHKLDDLKERRERSRVPARQTHARVYFRAENLPPEDRGSGDREGHRFDAEVKFWLFPQYSTSVAAGSASA